MNVAGSGSQCWRWPSQCGCVLLPSLGYACSWGFWQLDPLSLCPVLGVAQITGSTQWMYAEVCLCCYVTEKSRVCYLSAPSLVAKCCMLTFYLLLLLLTMTIINFAIVITTFIIITVTVVGVNFGGTLCLSVSLFLYTPVYVPSLYTTR